MIKLTDLNVIYINIPCSKQISLVVMHKYELFSGGTHFESFQGHKLSCVMFLIVFCSLSSVHPRYESDSSQIQLRCYHRVNLSGAALYHIMEGTGKLPPKSVNAHPFLACLQ